MTSYSFPSSLKRTLFRSVIVSVIATLGVFCGAVPGLAGHSAAYASQGVSPEEVREYARAVLSMESLRQIAYAQIKNTIASGNVPNIVCSEARSLQSLPGNAQSIATNYCNQSKKIVESNGLSISRFNTITINAQSNSDLKTRIENEFIRLQKGTR
ncbi:MAG: hypothetical protein NVS2B14_10080 [Chamaesiphon sp.]